LARNNSRVSDYGLTDGNILHLVIRLSDLQAVTVRIVCGKEFEFHIERNRNMGYVKQQIAKKAKGFFDLKDHELICDGEELEDKRLINEICKDNDAVIHLLGCNGKEHKEERWLLRESKTRVFVFLILFFILKRAF
jgi:hypothetical protein